MLNIKKWLAFSAAAAVFATACATAATDDAADIASTEEAASTVPTEGSTTSEATDDQPEAAQGVLPAGPSALDDMRADEFPAALIDIDEIISGGPPPDGIPPIEDPVFLPVIDNIDILDPDESVVALEIDGDARAYPVRAMIWHEIVNDTVGGVPVTVTYCPLCNSATTYKRVIRGVETTFGTSGRLFASSLVMYDRATESLWTHFDGRGVVGVLAGEQLESIPAPLMSWGDFREAYPAGQVLDWTQTGVSRPYGTNPYTGYDDPATDPFLFRGDLDGRARAKQRVVGVEIDGVSKAYALEGVSGGEAKATNTDIDGLPLVILWKAGQVSALDTASLDAGQDVGTVGVFNPVVDGQTLTFTAEGDRFVDAETGSVWLVSGDAVSGPLEGTSLERIEHLDTFWFAWSSFKPETELIES
jgi:hypothetical protein